MPAVQSGLSQQITPDEQSGLSNGVRQASLHSSLAATPRGSLDTLPSPTGRPSAPPGSSFGGRAGGRARDMPAKTHSPSDLLQRLAVLGPQRSAPAAPQVSFLGGGFALAALKDLSSYRWPWLTCVLDAIYDGGWQHHVRTVMLCPSALHYGRGTFLLPRLR